MRMLTRNPELARATLETAIVCGELEEVERIVTEHPELATVTSGPRGWEPLLYLCYARLPLPTLNENALAIARALLDRGADPNAYYMAGHARYSALVGVAGEGEQGAPTDHRYKEPLYQLLLERGAGPYDIQVLYNTHFSGGMLWWLQLTYAYDVARGDLSAWRDPRWSMLDMGGYGPGAHFILKAAIDKNDLSLAEWALAHGASPNDITSSHPKFAPKHTLYEEAVLRGRIDMADLLVRYGAAKSEHRLEGEEAFVDACLRLDRVRARALMAEHPGYLQSPTAIFAAVELGRIEVVEWLLDQGVSIEIEDEHKQRPLHVAAGNGQIGIARMLIARGAGIDPRETQWNATPLGYAVYGNNREMIELLTPYTRSVWHLAWLGEIYRLEALLREEPHLAREVSPNDGTPLMWLPDDEDMAARIVALLLSHGADPRIRTKNDQMTAADYARQRRLDRAARMLEEAAAAPLDTLKKEA
jgi:ankyrin repeat protein